VQFVRYGEELACLALEVIHSHAYEKSRFLRGASVDEGKIVASDTSSLIGSATPLRYLHPSRQVVHLFEQLKHDPVKRVRDQVTHKLRAQGSRYA
jgi:hypothetical protein